MCRLTNGYSIYSSHCNHCKLVEYSSQLLTKNLHGVQRLPVAPLQALGLDKTFMAMLNSLQTNHPLSMNIHCLECFFIFMALYNSITKNRIKKRLHPALSTLFVPNSSWYYQVQVRSHDFTIGDRNNYELMFN